MYTNPKNAIGNSGLVLLSDGKVAEGFMAYVQWTCDDGSHLSYLLMAKSRIKRTTKLSTPRRAVLSKRWRVPIEKEVVYIHLVDSENIVNMLQITSYRF